MSRARTAQQHLKDMAEDAARDEMQRLHQQSTRKNLARIKELETALTDVLDETSHIGRWSFSNVLPKELWDKSWKLLEKTS